MNTALLISLVFGLQILCLIYSTLKTSDQKDRNSYYLASKKLTFWPLLMTFIATLIGGGSTLGAAEEAYIHGYIIFLYPLGGLIGFMLIAFWFGKKLHSLNVPTLAQVFEDKFKSSFLKKLASALSIIALLSILIGQIIATRKFLISLNISSDVLLILFWMIVSIYTAWGGLKAVAYTDVIQGAFFILVFSALIYFMEKPVLFNSLGSLFDSADYHIDKYSSWLLLPMLFMLIEQDVAQRCFGAQNSKVVKKAALYAALVSFAVSMVPICLGSSARFHGLNLPLGSSVLICAVQEFMSPVMAAFAGSAVIAAIVSTADSQLNAISSNIACDFSKSLNIKGIRVLTVFIALLAVVSSYLFDNVIDVIMFSLEMYLAICFVPLMFGIYASNHRKSSAYTSMFCGALAFITLKTGDYNYLPNAVIELIVSLMGYFAPDIVSKSFIFRFFSKKTV
jgi:solute:Na+ symporter, SSS family